MTENYGWYEIDFEKFLLCGYSFFNFMPAWLLRKSFIFNENDNCEFQQAIHLG